MTERAWWVIFSMGLLVLFAIVASISGPGDDCGKYSLHWLWCLR